MAREREDVRVVLLELDSLNTMIRSGKTREEASSYKSELCHQFADELGVNVVNIKGESFVAIAGTEAQISLCEKRASVNANKAQGLDPDYNRADIKCHDTGDFPYPEFTEAVVHLQGLRAGTVPTFYQRELTGEIKVVPRRAAAVRSVEPGGGGMSR